MIIIIDYDCGNLVSIKNMIKKIGFDAVITSDPSVVMQASKIILPGVGFFRTAMESLSKLNLIDILNEKVLSEHIPTLGICLGMQLLTEYSEEGDAKGLGWIEGSTIRFKLDQNKHKIPHMGWNEVSIYASNKKESFDPLMDGVEQSSRYYFVHSYHLTAINPEFVLGETCHGYSFASIIRKNNVFGVQFHPEKSHRFGKKILENFMKNC